MLQFLRSSLGKKCVMAISGALLFGFVIIHMIGNLQIFIGPESINSYAAFLKSKMGLLWSFRVGLLIVAVLHIISAAQLSIDNKRARPVPYAEYKPVGSSYASQTMLMSGLIILVFLVYHLLHFTVRIPSLNLTGQDFRTFLDPKTHHPDVFRMMIAGYSNIWVSGFYILGMALLCLHLSHGVASAFQSLGLKNERTRGLIDGFARTAAAIIFIGNCSIPIAILLGYGK